MAFERLDSDVIHSSQGDISVSRKSRGFSFTPKVNQERNEAIALLRLIRKTLMDVPEINIANYTEDDVVALNQAVCNCVCEMDESDLDLCEEGDLP